MPKWEVVSEGEESKLTRCPVPGGHLYLVVVRDTRGAAAAAMTFVPASEKASGAAGAKARS